MNVHVVPLSAAARVLPARLRPLPPPIFPSGEPSADDRDLARELWRELDDESRAWYVVGSPWLAE